MRYKITGTFSFLRIPTYTEKKNPNIMINKGEKMGFHKDTKTILCIN